VIFDEVIQHTGKIGASDLLEVVIHAGVGFVDFDNPV
jgi:hypothetical protein